MYWHLSEVEIKYLLMFINVYIGSRVPLELKRYRDLSRHFKVPQNSIYCLHFLKNYKIWKRRPCFIPQVTCSVLSVGVLSVSSLLCDVFFTVWEHMCSVHGLSDIATVTKEGVFLRMVNCVIKSQFCAVQ